MSKKGSQLGPSNHERLAVLAVEIRDAVDNLTPKLLEAHELCRRMGKPFRDWLTNNNIGRANAYRLLAEARDPALADQRREKNASKMQEARKPAEASVQHIGHSATPSEPQQEAARAAVLTELPVATVSESPQKALKQPAPKTEPTPAPAELPLSEPEVILAGEPDPEPRQAAQAAEESDEEGWDAMGAEEQAGAEREYVESVNKVMEADDKMSAAHAEIKRQAAQIAALEARIVTHLNTKEAAVAIVKERDKTIRGQKKKLDMQAVRIKELEDENKELKATIGRVTAPPGAPRKREII